MVDNRLSIPLGIIIGLLASFVQSLGLTIQRKSHVLNQTLPEHRQRVEHRRPLWLLGFLIFISSNILGSFVQIASLPVVILAPLGAVSLLWNAFFARFLLGDEFSPWMILGTILIAGGAIMIAFFGIVPEQTRSLEDLLQLFRRPTFIVYFSVLGFMVFVCLLITHIMEYSFSRKLPKLAASDSSSIDLSPSIIDLPTHNVELANSSSGHIDDMVPASECTPLLDGKYGTSMPPDSLAAKAIQVGESSRTANRTRLLLAISYASFSGIISGMCLLFAKSGVELLILTVGGKNQFWRWESWVLILGLIIFALLQLWYLHKALVLADPTLVCPSAFCFYNLSSIINGLVYFNQFSLIPPLHLGLVSLGIFILLCGVWVVSIQPGGGGVDMRPWTEEGSLNLPGDDLAIYPATEGNEDEDTMMVPHSTVRSRQKRPEVGPVRMDRETRSESNLPSTSPPPPSIGIDLKSTGERLTQSSIFPLSNRKRAETQLYSCPRAPTVRQPTYDASTRSRNMSYPHPNASLLPNSSSIGTVSTLSTGFQIGLSPLSPGFTILPLERRRRLTGMQLSFADVGNEVVESVRERRRTVSEGSARVPHGGRVIGDSEAGGGNVNITDLIEAREHAQLDSSHGRERWHWLREIFMNKD